jgi:GNAT superfamily N-acetyltransferase
VAHPVEAPRIRPALASDAAFLADMLAVAAYWRDDSTTPEGIEVVADPALARYVLGWPRPGDTGVVAEHGGQRLGAAWYRFFSPAEPGYGFTSPEVPELTLAVLATARGQGLGRRLLEHLIAAARRAGVRALSLSVESDNPARNLYVSAGFRVLASTGGAETMLLSLAAAAEGDVDGLPPGLPGRG